MQVGGIVKMKAGMFATVESQVEVTMNHQYT
jgi:hypothetical protein